MRIEKVQQFIRQVERTQIEKQHDALIVERRRLDERLKQIEENRLRLNREMNRNGQNVDQLA
jgi:hypothetical protein